MKLRKISKIILIGLCLTCFCACGRNSESNEQSVPMQQELLQVANEKRYTEFIAEDINVESDIIFATVEGYNGQMQELGLDIYSPQSDEETTRPAIIWVHGGGYTSGDKANDGLLKYLATDFAKMGYVSVVPNYRLAQKINLVEVDRTVEDIRTALQWVIANGQSYGIDVNNIALAGYSAGGGIVQNLCYSNLYEEMDRSNLFAVVSISGDGLHHSITGSEAPTCLAIHGTADSTVDYTISEDFIEKVSKYVTESELYSLEGLNHNLLSRYDDIRNKIASFLYHQLTGQELEITIGSEVSIEYESVQTRLNNGIEYQPQPINCQVDGSLEEWATLEAIPMNQLKDAGDTIPSEEDYTGKAMVGWNPESPNLIYIAAEINDDVYQDNLPADGTWYHDDCLEIIFDLSESGTVEQFTKYVVGASEDLSVLANKESTQAAVVQEGNTYYYEVAIDLSVMPEGTLQREGAEQLISGKIVGFSIAYNDSDNRERESQIGWTSGKSSDRACFGNLVMP